MTKEDAIAQMEEREKRVPNGLIENQMERSNINNDRRYNDITVERERYLSTKSVLRME